MCNLYVKDSVAGYRLATADETLVYARKISKLRSGKKIMTSIDSVREHLQLAMGLLKTEEMRVLYVNNVNKLLAEEILSQGQEDQTAVYPRQIMRHCLQKNATGIIIVHNHPTGVSRPSNADIRITRDIAAAAATLEIRLLDHLIICANEYFSFRENGLIE